GLANLTVEPHPETEAARIKRQEKGKKHPSVEEQQHCLFGFFGAKGAEKLLLLNRMEWPVQNSLYEVRQAIIWVQVQGASGSSAPPDDDPRQGVLAEDASLNPPLD
ncbi:MAG: hypothetical protein ACOC91_01560, partial [bacterium]